ncbi:MAG: AtpZ/AtpI family protein [Chloroflexi bacterium]|nr:AtpZ/AtpI family protein [Chloroflexota bacterium]
MGQEPEKKQDRKQYWINLTLAGAAGQVGCVTLLIVIAAALGGLWLDDTFQTRPVFTIILLLASIPVSLAAMLYIVRMFTSKIKAGPPPEGKPQLEDDSVVEER